MKEKEILLGILTFPFLLVYLLLFNLFVDNKLLLNETVIDTYELLFTNIYQGHTGGIR